MAVFNDVEPTDKLVLYPHAIEWRNGAPVPIRAEGEVVKVDSEEPLRAECAEFLHCLLTRRQPRTDGEEGLRVLRVLDWCQRAMAPGGRGVPFNEAERKFFAHPSAFIDEGAEINEGTRIWHVSHVLEGSRIGKQCRIGQNVVIGPRVIIGNRVKIQNNVSVYEGVTLEDDVFCGPSMVFTNVVNPRSAIPRMHELRQTLVKRGATLGANCTIVCGTTIGEYAFVGAGAVVTKDVPPYALVLGVPARLAGWLCQCGIRLRFEGKRARCGECGLRYQQLGNRVQPTPEGEELRAQG
jgi:UDP-2-acetamido-3-amino-2,3-dideoxy-glucuronate N-acetyltransferase